MSTLSAASRTSRTPLVASASVPMMIPVQLSFFPFSRNLTFWLLEQSRHFVKLIGHLRHILNGFGLKLSPLLSLSLSLSHTHTHAHTLSQNSSPTHLDVNSLYPHFVPISLTHAQAGIILRCQPKSNFWCILSSLRARTNAHKSARAHPSTSKLARTSARAPPTKKTFIKSFNFIFFFLSIHFHRLALSGDNLDRTDNKKLCFKTQNSKLISASKSEMKWIKSTSAPNKLAEKWKAGFEPVSPRSRCLTKESGTGWSHARQKKETFCSKKLFKNCFFVAFLDVKNVFNNSTPSLFAKDLCLCSWFYFSISFIFHKNLNIQRGLHHFATEQINYFVKKAKLLGLQFPQFSFSQFLQVKLI